MQIQLTCHNDQQQHILTLQKESQLKLVDIDNVYFATMDWMVVFKDYIRKELSIDEKVQLFEDLVFKNEALLHKEPPKEALLHKDLYFIKKASGQEGYRLSVSNDVLDIFEIEFFRIALMQ